jgi:hypothetical protein
MNDAHKSIQDNLARLSEQCEGIEIRCNEVGAAARNLQLPEIVESLRKIIKEQLSQNGCKRSTTPTDDYIPQSTASGEAEGGNDMGPSTLPASYNTDMKVRQLSDLVKERKCDLQEGPVQLGGIVNEISGIMEELKSLSTGQGTTKPPQAGRGVFLYREIQYTLDELPNAQLRGRIDPGIEDDSSSTSKGTAHLPFCPEGFAPADYSDVCLEPITYWTSEEVTENSQRLEKFFSRERILFPGPVKPALVSRQIIDKLVRWSKATGQPQTLWISGRYRPTRDMGNEWTKVAINLINLARCAKPRVSMISFFCQPASSYKTNSDVTPEIQAMTSMLYAVIIQLVEILPPRISNKVDLSSSRFRCLNGKEDSWEDALLLLGELIGLVKQPVFCILDGFQWLEHASTQSCLKDLIGSLRQSCMHILFITTGTSPSLRDTISKPDTLSEEYSRVGNNQEYLGRHSEKFWN